MSKNNFDILFAIMAVQEVVFFAPMAKRLMEEEGLRVAFLTFHEAGDDILEKEGIPYFSLHKMKRQMGQIAFHSSQIEDIEDKLNIQLKKLIVHEMLTASRQDEAFLRNKIIQYYEIIDKTFKENNIGCVVQELGGFIAPQLLYHISRYHGVNHVFIEPAMFPKRVVFTLNSMYADIPEYGERDADSHEGLTKLLAQYRTQKTVVIPKKDRHFFQDMTLKRLLSPDNFRRLARKLYHKYILGRKEEYNAILWYIVYHILKLARRKALRLYYAEPVEGGKYIYYPFHVPLDVQLTVRCPEFLDQETIVSNIARSLPAGYKLYVKEHPAAIGGHSMAKMREIVKQGNIRLIHPRHNSFYLIKNSQCVVTINSKVGFEAIMQGKPVVVLGKTFYRGKGVTVDVDKLADIPDAISNAINMKVDNVRRDYFLNQAFQWSYKGELYENSPENVENFYSSLKIFISKLRMLRENITAEGVIH